MRTLYTILLDIDRKWACSVSVVKVLKKINLLLLCTLTLPLQLLAQVEIVGTIRNAESGEPEAGVIVMLQSIDGRKIYKYQNTNQEGKFALTYQGEADSLLVVVTGFNIKQQSKQIDAKNQVVDFLIESAVLQIREVTIKAPSIIRRKDTLTYLVGKFIDDSDRSIGDVLKKMPGIEVANSGEIKYNGRPINKFYIEGLDLLEGRYGVATNNIQAKDIASVDVFEAHQPIKALKDILLSEQAALNLRLKKGAKGVWSGTMLLGAGYKPIMWSAEAVAMYFTPRFQTISTYKTDNTGDDVSRELISFYGGIEEQSNLLSVHKPIEPALDAERYLKNNVHSVSLNTITKLNDNLECNANAQYTHDFQTAQGSSLITYYLPNAAPVVIQEITSTNNRNDRAELNLQLRSNTDKRYLLDKLTLLGRWDNNFGSVTNNGEQVEQQFRQPLITIRNQFNGVKRFNNKAIRFSSDTDYNIQSGSLRVMPMIYSEIFGNQPDYPNGIQCLDSRRFRSVNQTFIAHAINRWTFSLSMKANINIEEVESALSPMNDNNIALAAEKSMRNDIYWQRLGVILGPGIGYSTGDKFNINLYVPVDLFSLQLKDKVCNSSIDKNKAVLNPSLKLSSTIRYNLRLNANASYSEQYGGIYDTYSGYIMSDYRVISNKRGELLHNKTQNYSAGLSYGDVINELMGSLNVSYWHRHSNLMYGTTYTGSLSRIESYDIPNSSNGYNTAMTLSKRFDAIATTVNLQGGFMQSWSQVLRQDVVVPTRFDNLTIGLGFNSLLFRAIRIIYDANYTRSKSYVENTTDFYPIDILKQNASVNFIIKKNWICRFGAEHYYNTAISGADSNMYFFDASLDYNTKRVEYSLEGRNLLNVRSFNSARTTELVNYVYSYQLRPFSIMLKVKFGLR